MVWIPILSLPVGPYKAASLLEIGRFIQVFLATLDFSLHAATSLSPFAKMVLSFFVSSFVSELLVFVLPPDLLKTLFFEVSGREIRIEVGTSLELVRGRVLHLLLIVCVEGLERGLECGTFCLPEGTRCV